MNYFELFGLPITFTPDSKVVKQQFYALSRKYHPDFFTNESEAAQQEVLEISSLVNKAFKTLTNQDATIKYILQLNGLLEDDEKYQLPSPFLIEIMELNELADELGTNAAQKDTLLSEIDTLKIKLYATIETIITNYKAGVTAQEALLQVKEYYFKKKYVDRILAGIK